MIISIKYFELIHWDKNHFKKTVFFCSFSFFERFHFRDHLRLRNSNSEKKLGVGKCLSVSRELCSCLPEENNHWGKNSTKYDLRYFFHHSYYGLTLKRTCVCVCVFSLVLFYQIVYVYECCLEEYLWTETCRIQIPVCPCF